MRRVWATIATLWVTITIVGFLAWTRPPASAVQGVPRAVVVEDRHGVPHVVVVAAAPHATTQTSPGGGAVARG